MILGNHLHLLGVHTVASENLSVTRNAFATGQKVERMFQGWQGYETALWGVGKRLTSPDQ